MMRYLKLCMVVGALALTACNNQKSTNSLASDELKVAIDETFRPIMEEELKVFATQYPEADIQPHFVSEIEAINMLLKDSVRTIIATRMLNDKEKDLIKSKYSLNVRQRRIATDALALIVNKDNMDTLINLSQIKDIVTGKITRWNQLTGAKTKGDLELVFDNKNSSTVRYILDSICAGSPLGGNLKAQKTNQEVIDYVAKTRNAIGVIGVDWVGNKQDSTKLSFTDNVRVMSVSRSAIAESVNSFRPFQYYIATGDYPLTRGVFVISTDPRTSSQDLNFFFFLGDTSGQLIITKSSQLLPAVPVQIKDVSVTE